MCSKYFYFKYNNKLPALDVCKSKSFFIGFYEDMYLHFVKWWVKSLRFCLAKGLQTMFWLARQESSSSQLFSQEQRAQLDGGVQLGVRLTPHPVSAMCSYAVNCSFLWKVSLLWFTPSDWIKPCMAFWASTLDCETLCGPLLIKQEQAPSWPLAGTQKGTNTIKKKKKNFFW